MSKPVTDSPSQIAPGDSNDDGTKSRDELGEQIRKLIDVRANRIHYAETRRHNLATLAIAMVASSVSLFIACVSIDLYIYFKTAGILGCIVWLITGTTGYWKYLSQTNPEYPFKKFTNTWKWFYRDSIPTWCNTVKLHQQSEALEKVYQAELESFTNKFLSIDSNKVESLRQDIHQLFVLDMNESSKNEFINALRDHIKKGLRYSCWAVFISLPASYFYEQNAKFSSKQSSLFEFGIQSNILVEDTDSFKFRPPFFGNRQAEVSLSLMNFGSDEWILKKIEILDPTKGSIAEISDNENLPLRIRPKEFYNKSFTIFLDSYPRELRHRLFFEHYK